MRCVLTSMHISRFCSPSILRFSGEVLGVHPRPAFCGAFATAARASGFESDAAAFEMMMSAHIRAAARERGPYGDAIVEEVIPALEK